MKNSNLALISILCSMMGSVGDALATSDAGLATHRATLCSQRGQFSLPATGEEMSFDLGLREGGETRVIAVELVVEVLGRVTDGVDAAALEYRSVTSEWASEFVTLRPCDSGDCAEDYFSLVASLPIVGPLAEYSHIHLRLNRPVEFPGIQQVCVQVVLEGDEQSPPGHPEAGAPDMGGDADGPGPDAAPHFDAAPPGQPLPPPLDDAADCSTSGRPSTPWALLAMAILAVLRRCVPRSRAGRSSRNPPR